MLNLMRKHASSWMIKIILFAIVVVFIFWGVGSFVSRKSTELAKINGEVISYDAYRKAYDNLLAQYRRIYGSKLSDDLLKTLRLNEQALDQLENRVLMLQEARRLKIRVTNQELAQALQHDANFQNNGVFDYQRYRQILALNNLSVEDFENSRKQDLRIGKLRALILEGVAVSEDEAREWYNWYNAEVNLEYVLLDPGQYKNITPDQKTLEEHFKAHEKDYMTEPLVKVRYLYFDPHAYQAQAKVTEEDIAEYYDEHRREFRTEKTVEARHILLKVDPQADPKTVELKKQKAMEIYEMAKSGKDFADLARKYSEGPTRDKGGYLGTFKRESMVKPFADKAFSMKAGQISEPVRTQYGWHIIKIEKINEAKTRSLEEVRDLIRQKVIVQKAKALARDKAEKVYDNVFDGDDLNAAAQTYQVPVKTTDFFSNKGPQGMGIADPRQFAEVAFGLEKMAISEIQEFGGVFYLLQVIDLVESKVPEFQAVADKVKADVIRIQQREQAKKDAEALLAEIKKGKTLSEAAADFHLKPDVTGFFKRSRAIPKIGYEPQIVQAAFKLSEANPLNDQALQGKQGWYIIRLKARRAPLASGFDKDRDTIVNQLLARKKQSTLQQWLDDLKARSEIKINRELIK